MRDSSSSNYIVVVVVVGEMNRTGLPRGYVGVYEFAREAGLDVTYIYKLLYGGKIPGAKKIGRKWAIPQKELEARLNGT